MYDIFFISYNEPYAYFNWTRLKERFIFAKRIDGVKGIHQAHIEAARQSMTKMFYVVDADAHILSSFDFSYKVSSHDLDVTHVFISINPVNDLRYGYGAVKLLPTELVKGISTDALDMTLSISSKFKVVNELSNVTKFNTDPYNTWRSAFRESTKLTLKYDLESAARLYDWMNLGSESQYGQFSIDGARAGNIFAKDNIDKPENLLKINDFDFLKCEYDRFYSI